MKPTTHYMIFSVLLCLMRSALAGEEGVATADVDDLLVDLDVFVVQATRSTESVFELPYTVDVVDQETMFRNSVRSLPEALSETPGVLVQKTANGHGSPFIRGFTGYRTLTMIDGVRYNNSVYRDGPNEYFSLIDFNTVDQLELLLGPSSTLFGSDAVGGTVNLRSKSSEYLYEESGSAFMHGSQSYRYSSGEDSHITRTEFDFGVGAAWGLFVGYSWKQFGEVDAADIGRQEKTDYDEWSWDARFDMSLGDQWALTFAHQYLEQDDVWRTHSTIYGVSFSGTDTGSDLRRLKDQSRELNYAKLVGEELDGVIDRAVLTLSYQKWDEDGDRVKSDSSRIVEDFDSRMYGVDIQFESETEIGDFLYGVDLYRDEVDSRRVDYNSDGSLDEVRIQGPVGDDSTYDIAGSYIQGEFALTDRLTLLSGGRYTYTRADIGRFEDPQTGGAASFDDSWDSFVSSVRLSYIAGARDQLNLWAGVSQSFRAPNVADVSRLGKSRSNETEVAAADLDPEAFLTYELGLKAEQGPFELTLSYYYTDISDFITSTPTGNEVDGLIEVSKQNSANGYVQGVECVLDYQMSNNWSSYLKFAWQEGELDTVDSIDSNQSVTEPMSRMMPMTGMVGVMWSASDHRYWLKASAVVADRADRLSSGDRADTERIPSGGTPGYTVVSLVGGCRLNEHLEFNLGFENLLDEAYRTHGSGSNEPGFGVNFGVRASF